MAAFVSVRGLRKKYGDVWVVDDISFDIEEGTLLVLLGPSGCGKTTTLRCIGGLETPEGGKIVIDGQEVTDAEKGVFLQPETRGMGMVAQSYAIWPHMSVYENVIYALRIDGENRTAYRRHWKSCALAVWVIATRPICQVASSSGSP